MFATFQRGMTSSSTASPIFLIFYFYDFFRVRGGELGNNTRKGSPGRRSLRSWYTRQSWAVAHLWTWRSGSADSSRAGKPTPPATQRPVSTGKAPPVRSILFVFSRMQTTIIIIDENQLDMPPGLIRSTHFHFHFSGFLREGPPFFSFDVSVSIHQPTHPQ